VALQLNGKYKVVNWPREWVPFMFNLENVRFEHLQHVLCGSVNEALISTLFPARSVNLPNILISILSCKISDPLVFSDIYEKLTGY